MGQLGRLGPASDLAGLDTARAGVDPLRRAIHDSTNALDVRIPPTIGSVVRMGNLFAEERLLPTDVTDGCHRPEMVAGALGSRAFRQSFQVTLEEIRGQRPFPVGHDRTISAVDDGRRLPQVA